jgi:hypothetical protein
LVLTAGGFDGPAAEGLVTGASIEIMKAPEVVFEVADGALEVLLVRLGGRSVEGIAQFVGQARGLVGFELLEQGADPFGGLRRTSFKGQVKNENLFYFTLPEK